jgi:cyclin E
MRAILFDWLVEVCEVYRLHRETFYLAVDFIDRYLCATTEMPKTRLQLVGVSCLFIAAKIEEIYPPKLQEFAFVTDGACSEDEIVQMELVVLKGLNWGLSPMTPNRWMKTYMQVNNFESSSNSGDMSDSEYDASDDFVIPQYTDKEFIRAMQLLDLVILDLGSLSYKYSVLTASVLYHCQDEQAALSASGYRWEDISTCVEWMAPFAFAMRGSNNSVARGKTFTGVTKDDQHNIQSHSVELSMLERAQQRQALIAAEAERSRHSPDPQQNIQDYQMGCLEMTPPEETPSQMSVSNNTTYYESGTGSQYDNLQEGTNLDERVKVMQNPRQQSSVFLSPASDDSGSW